MECRSTDSSPLIEASSEATQKRRKVFKPESNAFELQYLSAFMKEVKEKQISSGLQSRAFWPESLVEHLAIERTASLINAVRHTSFEFNSMSGGGRRSVHCYELSFFLC